jgi:hypothetical protein
MQIALQHDFDGMYPGSHDGDLTLYYPNDATGILKQDFDLLAAVLDKQYSATLEVTVCDPGTAGGIVGRGLACWCQGRSCIALTIRSDNLPRPRLAPHTSLLPGPRYPAVPYKLAEYIRKAAREGAERACPADPENDKVTGLIVIAGQTRSGKSVLADDLIRALLLPQPGQSVQGLGHVVALGSPPEWLPDTSRTGSIPAKLILDDVYREFGICYTPRDLLVDTCLKDALVDALRQKPAVVYIDEVREDDDWPAILRFAESGHLVITTAHSASIRDAVSWILRSVHVTRRSQAPAVARNILAVIHAQLCGSGRSTHQRPEIWLGARGAAALGAYGPAALVPESDEDAAYISRHYIAHALP